jgi:hypothetical protein
MRPETRLAFSLGDLRLLACQRRNGTDTLVSTVVARQGVPTLLAQAIVMPAMIVLS